MHWGIGYLREDIQDLRAEAREYRAEVKSEFANVRTEFTEVRKEMREGDQALRTEVVELRQSLEKRIDTRFYWIIGLMATMLGAHTALTAALIKL